jgi:DNA-binding CsgD family transcriptional regulator
MAERCTMECVAKSLAEPDRRLPCIVHLYSRKWGSKCFRCMVHIFTLALIMAARMQDRRGVTKWLMDQPLVRAYAQLYPSVVGGLEKALSSATPDATRAISALLSAANFADGNQCRKLALKYRLSPTEAQLATYIADGGTLAGYAKRRRVSVETARSQLRNIFAKMGVRRQSEMVALVVGGRARA